MNSKKFKKVLSTSIASLTVLSTLNGSISTKIYASLDGDVPQKTEATSQAEKLLLNGYYNNTEIKILSVQYGKCVFHMYYGNLNDNEKEQFLELFTNENTINTLKSVEIPEEKNLKEVNVNLTNIFPSIINTSEHNDITKEEIAKRLLDECFDNAIKSISSSSENSDEILTSTAAETENKLTMEEQLVPQLDSMDAQLDQISLRLHSMMNGSPTEQNDSVKPKEETIEETKVISEGNSSLDALEKQADQMASQLSSILSKFSIENDSLKDTKKEPLKTIETDTTKTKDELTGEIKAVSENNPTVESPESSKPDSKTEEEPKEQNPTQTPVISENESKSNSKSEEDKSISEDNSLVESSKTSESDSDTEEEPKKQNPAQAPVISENESESNSKSEEAKSISENNPTVETPKTSESDSKTEKEPNTTNNDDNDPFEILRKMFGENSADSKIVPSAKNPEISNPSFENKQAEEANQTVKEDKPASTGLNTSANAAPALNLPKNNKSKKPGFFSRIWMNIKKFLRMLPLIGRIFR